MYFFLSEKMLLNIIRYLTSTDIFSLVYMYDGGSISLYPDTQII